MNDELLKRLERTYEFLMRDGYGFDDMCISLHEARELIKAQSSKLSSLQITHPTDVCECRFDFGDWKEGEPPKMRNVCKYHAGILSRLDSAQTEHWKMENLLRDVRKERDELASRLDSVLGERDLLRGELFEQKDRLDLYRTRTIRVGSIDSTCYVCRSMWANSRGAELHEDWCPNKQNVVENQTTNCTVEIPGGLSDHLHTWKKVDDGRWECECGSWYAYRRLSE
jgi:hypothetical protein